MSPEQAREDDVTGQTDLYSLGVVAYELLTGKAPFDANGLSKLINQILHEDPPRERSAPGRAGTAGANRHQSDVQGAGCPLSVGTGDGCGPGERVLAPGGARGSAACRRQVQHRAELPFFNEFTDEEVAEVIDAAEWKQFQSLDSVVDEGSLEHSFSSSFPETSPS